MNDIIERLRKTASRGVSVWGDLQMEAAAEIETLRGRLALPAPAPVVPDGWVMVLREPTIAMCIAGDEARHNEDDATRTPAIYRAMIAAAPAVPADEFEVRADGEKVRKDRWEWGIRRIVALLWGNRRAFEVDEVVDAVRGLVPMPNDDDESLCATVQNNYVATDKATPDYVTTIEVLRAHIARLESAAPAVREPQPVSARPASEYHEDHGAVLWWTFPINEPPYCGQPSDNDWPAYHTHWTPLVLPDAPKEQANG